MKHILTLTLNPSIDGSSETDRVRPTHKMRTSNERFDPGGGGINVARVIRELGSAATAIYLAGGATGSVLAELLRERGIDAQALSIGGHTRISHTVYERASGLEYRFVPEGPEVREHEWQACLALLESLDAAFLVASGSLPRGVPDDFYAHLSRIAARKGMRFVLDTSGPALQAALLEGGVHLVKPSSGEFEGLIGRPLSADEIGDEALRIVRSGKAALVAVTRGHEGALLATREGILTLPALPVEVRSAVGAGDSFVAAMTVALVEGRTPVDAFMRGIAGGTAAVLTPGTGLCRREDVERLCRREDVERLYQQVLASQSGARMG